MSESHKPFNEAYRESKAAQERGSTVAASEEVRYFYSIRDRIRAEKGDQQKIDKALINYGEILVTNAMQERHPDLPIKERATVVIGDQDFFRPHRGITITRKERSTYGDALFISSVAHEFSHQRSYMDTFITREATVERSGLATTVSKGNVVHRYFQGINEAVTMFFESDALRRLPDTSELREGDVDLKRALQERNDEISKRHPSEYISVMAEMNFPTVSLQRKECEQGTKSVGYSHYLEDVISYLYLLERIANTHSQEFTNIDDVAMIIERAYLTGDQTQFKKLIRETYGSKGLLLISRWETLDSLYPKQTQDRFMDFIKGNPGDIDQLIADMTVMTCSSCGEKTGGTICVHCQKPRTEKSVVETTIECTYCGSTDQVKNGVCKDCRRE